MVGEGNGHKLVFGGLRCDLSGVKVPSEKFECKCKSANSGRRKKKKKKKKKKKNSFHYSSGTHQFTFHFIEDTILRVSHCLEWKTSWRYPPLH